MGPILDITTRDPSKSIPCSSLVQSLLHGSFTTQLQMGILCVRAKVVMHQIRRKVPAFLCGTSTTSRHSKPPLIPTRPLLFLTCARPRPTRANFQIERQKPLGAA